MSVSTSHCSLLIIISLRHITAEWASSVPLDQRWDSSGSLCPEQLCSTGSGFGEVYSRPCNCDGECMTFGDCCWDFQKGEEVTNKFSRPAETAGFTCPDIRPLRKSMVYVVGHCSDDYPEIEVARKCETVSVPEEEYSYVLDVPVLSRRSNTTYRNSYCAFCHNQSDLIPLRATQTCDEAPGKNFFHTATYTPSELLWTEGNSSCRLLLDLDESLALGRRCTPSVSSCDVQWNDSSVEELCNNGYSLYVVGEGRLYKNPYCAVCNFVPQDSINCWDYLNQEDDNIFRLGVSYAVILDFSWTRCRMNELWDPLLRRCQPVHCRTFHREEFRVLGSKSLLRGSINRISTKDYYSGDVCEDLLEETLHQQAFSILTIIVISASSLCLVLHVIFFCLLSDLRKSGGKNLLCLSCSLLITHVIFLFGIDQQSIEEVCITVSVLLHYFYLACFAWMNSISIDVCVTFSKPQLATTRDHFTWYSLYSWLLPALIVATSIVLEVSETISGVFPERGTQVCFLGNSLVHGMFFLLPSGILLSVNVILFLVTLVNISKKASNFVETIQRPNISAQHSSTVLRKRTRVSIYFKLALLMGLTWCTGFVARFFDIPALWYPFVILNGLHGVFIFVAFDAKRKNFENIKDKFTKRKKEDS